MTDPTTAAITKSMADSAYEANKIILQSTVAKALAKAENGRASPYVAVTISVLKDPALLESLVARASLKSVIQEHFDHQRRRILTSRLPPIWRQLLDDLDAIEKRLLAELP